MFGSSLYSHFHLGLLPLLISEREMYKQSKYYDIYPIKKSSKL